MKHIHSAHPPVARHDVRGGVSLQVTHVQPGRGGVGEHVQNVGLGLFGSWLTGLRCPETARFGPRFLPAGLDFSERVSGASWHHLEGAIVNANPHAKSNLGSKAHPLDCHA